MSSSSCTLNWDEYDKEFHRLHSLQTTSGKAPLTPTMRNACLNVYKYIRTHYPKILPFQDYNKVSDVDLIYRFLYQSRFNVEETAKGLYEYSKWRENMHANKLLYEHIDDTKGDIESYFGVDKEGFLVMYYTPDPTLLMSLVYANGLDEVFRRQVIGGERGRFLANIVGCDRITAILDLRHVLVKNLTMDAISCLMKCLKMGQGWYPEFVHRVICFNGGWVVSGAWKVVKPLLDHITQKKVFFIPGPPSIEALQSIVDMNQIPKHFGGTFDPTEKGAATFDFSTLANLSAPTRIDTLTGYRPSVVEDSVPSATPLVLTPAALQETQVKLASDSQALSATRAHFGECENISLASASMRTCLDCDEDDIYFLAGSDSGGDSDTSSSSNPKHKWTAQPDSLQLSGYYKDPLTAFMHNGHRELAVNGEFSTGAPEPSSDLATRLSAEIKSLTARSVSSPVVYTSTMTARLPTSLDDPWSVLLNHLEAHSEVRLQLLRTPESNDFALSWGAASLVQLQGSTVYKLHCSSLQQASLSCDHGGEGLQTSLFTLVAERGHKVNSYFLLLDEHTGTARFCIKKPKLLGSLELLDIDGDRTVSACPSPSASLGTLPTTSQSTSKSVSQLTESESTETDKSPTGRRHGSLYKSKGEKVHMLRIRSLSTDTKRPQMIFTRGVKGLAGDLLSNFKSGIKDKKNIFALMHEDGTVTVHKRFVDYASPEMALGIILAAVGIYSK